MVSESDIKILSRVARIQGYCEATLKMTSEIGARKCAESILLEATEVMKQLRGELTASETGAEHV